MVRHHLPPQINGRVPEHSLGFRQHKYLFQSIQCSHRHILIRKFNAGTKMRMVILKILGMISGLL